jgi:signal transduction histidine kinase
LHPGKKDTNKTNLRNSLIKLVVLPSVLLTVITIISFDHSLWVSSEITHFYIELFAVILGGALAFYYLERYRVLHDNFSLFVGIGFCISVIIDLFHVITAFVLVEDVPFLKYFIPQTWFIGRLFLGAMLLIAIIKYSDKKEDIEQTSEINSPVILPDKPNDQTVSKDKRKVIVYIALLSAVAILTAFSSLFLVFPASVLDSYLLHRPYEIPPMILFCVCLFLFYKKGLYHKKDYVYKGLVVYLIIDAFTQLIMSFSAVSFDTAFNIAHVLKDSGYFVSIVALILSNVQYSANLKKKNVIISENLVYVKQSEKIKTDFINIAAHELRSPIQPILGLSELIDITLEKDIEQSDIDEMKKGIKTINRNALKLQKLSNDILDVSKIDSGTLKLNIERFDISEAILNTAKDFIETTKKKQKDLEIVCNYKTHDDKGNSAYKPLSDVPLWINGDRHRMIQVLSNLIDNAIKFTQNGTIDIIVEMKENIRELVVSISDTGQGISREVIPSLFKKFYSRSDKGTGLGLFISKSIVEAHGGKIWAENKEDNSGSTFRFSLPLDR